MVQGLQAQRSTTRGYLLQENPINGMQRCILPQAKGWEVSLHGVGVIALPGWRHEAKVMDVHMHEKT